MATNQTVPASDGFALVDKTGQISGATQVKLLMSEEGIGILVFVVFTFA